MKMTLTLTREQVALLVEGLDAWLETSNQAEFDLVIDSESRAVTIEDEEVMA
jgi:hypothetical protein